MSEIPKRSNAGRKSEGYHGKGGKGKARNIPKNIKERGEEGVGVSKIKAALRQTKRLLAKENLSATVRQEAARKLIALEDELKTKETQQRERKNAQKSHKIRFFERQKLVRKIKKLKRAAEEEGQASVEEDLLEARVLLNYVLHYPMTQKYVALFPNQGPASQEEGETEMDASSSKETASKVKERIRESMRRGDLSNEPEVELELRTKEDTQLPAENRKRFHQQDSDVDAAEQKKGKEQKLAKRNIEDDDFFAASDE